MKLLGSFNNRPKKERMAILLVASVLGFLFIADKTFLHGHLLAIVWFIDTLLFSLYVIAIMVIAGFVVMRSLVVIAGGLSLILFLGQEYCDASHHTATSDSALKGLLVFGIAYILYDFGVSLYNEIMVYLKEVDKDKWSWEKFLFVVLILSFAYMFVRMVYEVVNPIILDLCIYNG